MRYFDKINELDRVILVPLSGQETETRAECCQVHESCAWSVVFALSSAELDSIKWENRENKKDA